MILISAHSDTNFKHVSLKSDKEHYTGHLDNFVGVFAVLNSYFSGEINFPFVRVELTYGEEEDFAGAIEVAEDIEESDLIIVVDVTGTATEKDFIIEKAKNPLIREFLADILKEFSYDIYEDCPDPISDLDEIEIYKSKSPYYLFLGIPCTGGDYNKIEVSCRKESVEQVSKALIKICRNYGKFQELVS